MYAGDISVAQAAPRRSLAEINNDRELVLAMYREVIVDPDAHAMARIAAGDKLLDRVEGKAVSRQITAEASGLEDWVLDSMGEPLKKGVN